MHRAYRYCVAFVVYIKVPKGTLYSYATPIGDFLSTLEHPPPFFRALSFPMLHPSGTSSVPRQLGLFPRCTLPTHLEKLWARLSEPIRLDRGDAVHEGTRG